MLRDDPAIKAGDLDGLQRVYSDTGSLITTPGERILRMRDGCDIHVTESWRSILARTLFSIAPGHLSGRLYVTNRRIILIRDIDVWKEVKPLLTPLGLPAAAEKEARLKAMKARGARQYCEIELPGISVSRVKKREGMLFLYLMKKGGRKYRVILHTGEADSGLFAEILASFARQ